MEEQCDSATDSDRSSSFGRSDSRVVGEKWGREELEEEDEVANKHVKMRDLESVFRSEGLSTSHQSSLKNDKDNDSYQQSKERMSLITAEPVAVHMGGSKAERSGKNHAGSVDLNSEVVAANNSSSNCLDDAEKCAKPFSQSKPGRERNNNNCIGSRVCLDLNVEDVSSSAKQVPFHSIKNHCHTRSRDISECGSTTGPVENNDPLKRWMEMKQNGFLSSSYGGIPVPKPRGRKPKTNVTKKKMEIAKREQVDRFTKIAAPSGLLNDLNPGIINHVRNRKQVHSIIESLVRSEKRENAYCTSNLGNHLKSQSNEIRNWNDPENLKDSVTNQSCLSSENECLDAVLESNLKRGYPMPLATFIAEEKSGDNNSSIFERGFPVGSATNSTLVTEDDALAPKFSSSTANASDNANSFSNEESGDLSTVSSLSIKAATAASQWLELLHQDVKGRLAALRRSKKKVRAVINTELPFLISKEFSSGLETDLCATKDSAQGFPMNATAEMHRARWTALFGQMDHSLCEEEKQLESWLNQVKEMQLHCDQGLLHNFQWCSGYGSGQLGTLENGSRSGKADSSKRELAVQAAAASIYSTCNLLMSKENVSCF